MELDLENKVALITGSSGGIGYAIAKKLNENGCRIILNGRNSETLNKSIESLSGSIGFVADVTCPTQSQNLVRQCISTFGVLDVLVCNVGSGKSVAPGEETFEEWQKSFSKNLWSATNVIEASRDHLIKTKGAIVCISSICGHEFIPGAPITYSSAKAALNSYVRGSSRNLGQYGIRINAVSPGNILFKGSVWDTKLKSGDASVKKLLDQEVSLSRLGSPEEIANLVTYLVSPLSSFVTGSIFTIDGGQVRS